MKKIFFLTILLAAFSIFNLSVDAQDRGGGNPGAGIDSELNIDNEIGLREIRIPIFTSFIDFNTENASIFSWLAFVGSLATIGLVVFWVFLLVKAGVKGMQSQGNSENLGLAFKQVQSVLIGAAISLLFPLVLSIIGLVLGIGTIFSWPKMFQLCDDSTGYQFYFQALLDGQKGDGTTAGADNACNPIGQ